MTFTPAPTLPAAVQFGSLWPRPRQNSRLIQSAHDLSEDTFNRTLAKKGINVNAQRTTYSADNALIKFRQGAMNELLAAYVRCKSSDADGPKALKGKQEKLDEGLRMFKALIAHLKLDINKPERVRILGTEIDITAHPLDVAMHSNEPEIVKAITTHPDFKLPDASGKTGRPATLCELNMADTTEVERQKTLDVLDLVLEAGAEVNAQNEARQTLMHLAVAADRADVVARLLAVPGINLNLFDKNGDTSVGLAQCREVSQEIRDLFLDFFYPDK